MFGRGLERFFVMACLLVSGVNASDTAGRGADDALRDPLSGTHWTLVALEGRGIDPALPAVTLSFHADGTLGGFDGTTAIGVDTRSLANQFRSRARWRRHGPPVVRC